VIVELDLPSLLVNIGDRFITSSVSANEFVLFEVELEVGEYPVSIFYSSAILY